jgi:hypothetical protein
MGFCSGHGGLCESDAECSGQCRVGQQWAFFYRQTGNTGRCGNSSYSRCLSTFKLPLGLPEVPGTALLTGADLHLDWHAWRMDDSVPTDVDVDSSLDLTNGTVLNITLPHFDEGVVGLVTVTPALDATPPHLTCPASIVVDATRPSGAVVPYSPSVSDNCSVTGVTCTPPSGSTFSAGDSTVGCKASDAASNTTSCSFTVHVKGPAEQVGDLISLVNGLATTRGIRDSLLAKLTAAPGGAARQESRRCLRSAARLHQRGERAAGQEHLDERRRRPRRSGEADHSRERLPPLMREPTQTGS